jgi:gamma-glutamylcyclotransferase (GGCT)/AIG2-like uncharacterized protein YtfP
MGANLFRKLLHARMTYNSPLQSHLKPMPCNIFTYGSLMFPAVWGQVVRDPYRSCKATLKGHARYAIADASYPGVIKQPDAVVEGILYLDVGSADVARLDAFEGKEYRRVAVQVVLADGAQVDAQAYLFTAVHRLQHMAWDADTFDIQRFRGEYCTSS